MSGRGVIGWEMTMKATFVVPNPHPVHRMPIPEDATPEQLAELERLIEQLNAEEDQQP